MVLKSIKRIKEILPEVKHTVMFYDDGTVFHTTYDTDDVNIPKIGKNLAEIVEHFRTTYEYCNFKLNDYKKMIIETDSISMVLLKLGESSNMALFLEKDDTSKLNLKPVRRYIEKIEELIDMYEYEIIEQKIETRLENIQEIQNELQPKIRELEQLNSQLADNGHSEQIETKFDTLKTECEKMKSNVEKFVDQIKDLQIEIDKKKNQ